MSTQLGDVVGRDVSFHGSGNTCFPYTVVGDIALKTSVFARFG